MTNLDNYRPGVGLVLINKENLIFVGNRKDEPSISWQMPQGGIDEGETAHQALFREAEEEIGCSNMQILQESSNWLSYDLPKELSYKNCWDGKYKGQKQKWFLCQFLGKDIDINIEKHHPSEFSEWKWATPKEVIDNIIPFKKNLYLSVLNEFKDFLSSKSSPFIL